MVNRESGEFSSFRLATDGAEPVLARQKRLILFKSNIIAPFKVRAKPNFRVLPVLLSASRAEFSAIARIIDPRQLSRLLGVASLPPLDLLTVPNAEFQRPLDQLWGSYDHLYWSDSPGTSRVQKGEAARRPCR